MESRSISRLLYALYPVVVIGITFAAWSSSELSRGLTEVKIPPPSFNEGFNYFWDPVLANQKSCTADDSRKWNHSCSTASTTDSETLISTH